MLPYSIGWPLYALVARRGRRSRSGAGACPQTRCCSRSLLPELRSWSAAAPMVFARYLLPICCRD